MRRQSTARLRADFTLRLAAAGLLLLAGCAFRVPGPAAAAPAGPGSYAVTLRPVTDEAGDVTAIDVSARLEAGLRDGETRLRLSAPVVYANVTGIADRITDLEVSDPAGPVVFTLSEDSPVAGGFPYFRHWTATRKVSAPVEISYRALVQPEGGPPGPAFGIRPSRGGVSGAGAGFMLFPANSAAGISRLDWDLSAFPPGALGASTFGEGAVTLEASPAALLQGWIMAGHPGRFPEAGEAGGTFQAYWLGDFPFDVAAEMRWARDMYGWLEGFFAASPAGGSYRVFLRQLDTPPYGGGTALANSFMLSRGPARPEEAGSSAPRATILHEMIHMWVGGLSGEHALTNWFSEGLTTYYEYTLPFRAGEDGLDAYLEGLNRLSERYYTNPARAMAASGIGRVGFDDGRIRHAPYQRGALYFADLDARLQAASPDSGGLDLFMREVLAERDGLAGGLTLEEFAARVSARLGGDELARLQAIHIDGAVIQPAPEAFGPCVVGRPAVYEAEDGPQEGLVWEPAAEAGASSCEAWRRAG